MSQSEVRVLLVDDDEDDFVMIRDLLRDLPASKYNLQWCSGYEEALEMIARKQHDVYLIDYRLGARNGLDLMKEAITNGCSSPLILLTGYGDADVDIEAMQSGAADYLIKGQITPQLLGRSIRYSIKRREDLEMLRESEENIRNLFDSTFEGIILHENGKIFDVNRTASKIFGYDREDMIGRDLGECCGKDLGELVKRRTAMKETRRAEAIGVRKDGNLIHLEISGKDTFYRSRPVRFTSFRDISDRKQMEAQIVHQDRLASIGILASGLAHEIGTPLGVIRGRAEYLSMLAEGQESIKKGMDVITSQIDRISKLIQSLLNLARNEHTSVAGPVTVAVVVEQVLALMSHEFRKNEIEITLQVPSIAVVKAEMEPFEQVILNLLVNALHAIQAASKEGRTSRHRIAVTATEGSDCWNLSVDDTGCGISQKNLEHIFKPFFTTKEVGVGTGLGLATADRIVRSWGGEIEVSSKEDVGSSFTIRLPKA